MSLFYVAHQGAGLSLSRNRLILSRNGKTLSWILLKDIEQLIILGNIRITPQAITALLTKGIDTIFLSIHGQYRGRLLATPGKNILLRILQFEHFRKPEFCLNFAKTCVSCKLINCKNLLRKRNYKAQKPEITKSVNRIRVIAGQVETAENLEKLRGFEGIAAKEYFLGLGKLIRTKGFEFTGRNRRPPKDRTNALLSFYYTLLGNRITSILSKTGLDPYLGALHSPAYGRPSLALDILEQFRPLVDAMALNAIHLRILKATDFDIHKERFPLWEETDDDFIPEENDYPVLLTHHGLKTAVSYLESNLLKRKTYLPAGKRLSWNQIIEEQARELIRLLNGKSESYRGYRNE